MFQAGGAGLGKFELMFWGGGIQIQNPIMRYI